MEILKIIIAYIIPFLAILSVIVFIHEYGHYWVAKTCGVKIESFSIGFGKEIFGWDDKNGVRWKISLIPLGGYVKMFGDEGAASTPDNEKINEMSEDDLKRAFHTQKLYKRFLIVLAGPVANFLLAIVILTGFFMYYGRPETKPVVAEISAGSAAEEIGLKKGDQIIELDGNKIDRFEQLKSIATLHPDIEITITYVRNGVENKSKITPRKVVTEDIFGNKIEVGLIGVASNKVEYSKLGFGSSFFASIEETYSISVKTLEAVGQMIVGQRSADQISGILRIADYSGKSVEKGMNTVLWFLAILSINLGLVNLFPIPMLDGGHLFFYLIEAVRGKPLSDKTQEYFFRFGFAVLICLMVFATFNDLKHFEIF